MKYLYITLVICLSACVVECEGKEKGKGKGNKLLKQQLETIGQDLNDVVGRVDILENLHIKPKTCDDGWVIGFDSETCYKFNRDPKSWEEAKTYCGSLGARMLKVETEGEHIYVKNLVETVTDYGYFWIGGRYNEETSTFTWEDGTSVGSFGWHKSRPSYSTKGCMDYLSTFDYDWNNHIDCINTRGRSICEKEL